MKRRIQSLISVIEDRIFDLRSGIETSKVVEVERLDIDASQKQHAVRYKPTRVRYFRKLMREYPLPKSTVFVDVGCGKGRVVLLAAMQGFAKTIGLELSPSLAETARLNMDAYRKRHPELGETSIVCTNVLEHQWQHDETVFFLFWPFDREVTIAFVDLVRQSIRNSPRDVTLIINEFQFRDLLVDDLDFKHVKQIIYGAAEFDIYESRNTSQHLGDERTVQAHRVASA